MSGAAQSLTQDQAVRALERRAEQILKARPAYREMVDFYLTVFRRQIEWRDRLVVHPQQVDPPALANCLRDETPLIERFDPGLDADSLVALWREIKNVFRLGNSVLEEAVGRLDAAEEEGALRPAAWLADQRPDRPELVRDAAREAGVDEQMLASLVRAVTLPHWQLVARSWLPDGDRLDAWRRARCPVCGALGALIELRTDRPASEMIRPSPRRFMHCAFCAACWAVGELKCPSCESTRRGDARYYFTDREPELRIEFCERCKHYIKVLDADRITGGVHVSLELLTTVHLDAIAQEKNLAPLEPNT